MTPASAFRVLLGCGLFGVASGGSVASARGHALQLEALSPSVTLGATERVDLRIRGTPELLSNVHVACSAGAVRVLKAGLGQVEVEYVPPRGAEVSWDLCAATALGGRYSATALPLVRRDLLILKELPSLSRVEVNIGGETYGPIRANGAGDAEIPVVLTPGARNAEVKIFPPGEAPQRRLQPLGVRPTDQLLFVTAETSVIADGTQALPVWAFALGEDGRPLERPLTFAASEGELSLHRVGPGAYVGQFVAFPRTTDGEARLSAQGPLARSGSIKVQLLAGLHPRLSLETPVHGLAADGLSSTDITVHVTDEAGRPLPMQRLALAVTSGAIGPALERAPGTYVARYQAPSGGVSEAVVSAAIGGAVKASLRLALTPPPRVSLEAAPSQLPADGQSRVTVRIAARGPDGRELPDGTRVQLSASLGNVPQAVPLLGGRAVAEFVAGTRSGDAWLEARALDAVARTEVRLLPGPPAMLSVRADRPVLRCDGKDSAELRMVLTDAHSNPLDGATLRLAAPGKFGPVRALGLGEFSVHYTPPPSCEAGPLNLTATTGSQGLDSPLSVVWARRKGFTGWVGAGIGFTGQAVGQAELEVDTALQALPQSVSGTLSLAVSAGTLGAIPPPSPLANAAGAGSSLAISLYAGPRWTFWDVDPWNAWVGAGLDGHAFRAGYRPDGASAEQVRMGLAAGAHVRAGIGYQVGAGTVLLQARYGFVELSPDPGLGAQFVGVGTSLGYRLTF